MQSKPPLSVAVLGRATAELEKNATELKELSKKETLFDTQAQFILLQIADIYGKCNPTASGDDYLKDFFSVVCASDLDPYEVLRGAIAIPGDAITYRLLAASLLLCNRANNAYRKISSDLGWAMLLDASYWCGYASLGDKFSDLSEIAAMAAKREAELVRIAGVEKSNDKKVEEVARLLKELAPKNGWKSRTYAAQKIQDHIIKNKSAAFLRLSPGERGQRTIKSHVDRAIARDPTLSQHIIKDSSP